MAILNFTLHHDEEFTLFTDATQIIWLLTPTVALCEQQHDVFARHLGTTVRTRLLRGTDNVDRWSDKKTWDAVLDGVRLVVSTYQVLSDALDHGFVTMDRLALLIFDEGMA